MSVYDSPGAGSTGAPLPPSRINRGEGVLGLFAKGCAGSYQLSLAPSGGEYCDNGCRNHPHNGGQCYVTRAQLRYATTLLPKLQRHETDSAARLIERAIDELGQLAVITWFRFSAFGGLPSPRHSTPKYIDAFRQLCQLLAARLPRLATGEACCHLPVESREKSAFYRTLLADLPITVRESCQTVERWLSHPGACSYVAGNLVTTGEAIRRRRYWAALSLAHMRRSATNRPVVICPATVPLEMKRRKILCGICRACARRNVDVVYVLH
jgi:hypothetical protein